MGAWTRAEQTPVPLQLLLVGDVFGCFTADVEDIRSRENHTWPRVSPAQVTVGEAQRDPTLALRRQLLAARVQLLQSSRPTLSVPGLSGEALHAPQVNPSGL